MPVRTRRPAAVALAALISLVAAFVPLAAPAHGQAPVEVGLVSPVVADVPMRVASADFADGGARDVQLQALNLGAGWGAADGSGVGVALIDTGVVDTPDLAGRLVRGPDLSGDGDGLDHHGHGTFMAGLIAGDGTASAGEDARHTGVAPGAHIVSVKVAGRGGWTSLSRVLAAIDWVIEHRDELNVKVLNVSLSVDPAGPWQADPLDRAVEAAWSAGIAVVVAAGNEGRFVTVPGDHPAVITVGATDTMGTGTVADDRRPAWSGQQQSQHATKPELVAPGVSVVSLRAAGSAVDEAHPDARIGDRYFRGTGTSMSAALASGATAALAARHPDASPDALKRALVAGARPVEGSLGSAIDVTAAEAAGTSPASAGPGRSGAAATPGRGLGRRVDPAGSRWAGSRWAGSRWADDEWAGSRWAGSRWAGSRWAGSRWATGGWGDAGR